MPLKIKFLSILFLFVANEIFCLDQILTSPTLESPESEFFLNFPKEKIANPIFLNGAVKAVQKKIIQHKTPDNETAFEESYDYELNASKEVIKYASDVEFDEMNPNFLNMEKDIIIKGDTIIKHGDLTYVSSGTENHYFQE